MMPDPQHSVHIVDDDAAVRASIKFLVESVNLNALEYLSADEFMANYRDMSPGCIILDLRMPGVSGLEAVNMMRDQSILEPIVIMTGHGDVPVAVRALKLGVFDFLEKPCNDNLLIETVHRAISKDVKDRLERASQTSIQNSLGSLTGRENSVLGLLVTGQSNKATADTLAVSRKTIERHRSSIMRKLNAKSFAHLVQIVERNRG
jgi:FixJ family two-component response regulator|tara:strand:+ start:603 stop:1217 length:615 start_codon:yes stop_codon:yes gene_type:complete